MNNKKYKLSATQRLSNAIQIPLDMATSLPYIKMYSNRELIVEDAGKLLHYDCTCVKVRQANLTISVSGNSLRIKCLSNNDMSVTGYITSLCFE